MDNWKGLESASCLNVIYCCYLHVRSDWLYVQIVAG